MRTYRWLAHKTIYYGCGGSVLPRFDTKLVSRVNSIALNVYRNVRRAPLLQELPELSIPPQINLAAIDVDRIFRSCAGDDRWILRRRYLEDIGIHDRARQEGRTTGA